MKVSTRYDPNNEDHKKRVHSTYTSESGVEKIRGILSVILEQVLGTLFLMVVLLVYLSQGQVVHGEKEFRESYYMEFPGSKPVDSPRPVTIYSHCGPTPVPEWEDETIPGNLPQHSKDLVFTQNAIYPIRINKTFVHCSLS